MCFLLLFVFPFFLICVFIFFFICVWPSWATVSRSKTESSILNVLLTHFRPCDQEAKEVDFILCKRYLYEKSHASTIKQAYLHLQSKWTLIAKFVLNQQKTQLLPRLYLWPSFCWRWPHSSSSSIRRCALVSRAHGDGHSFHNAFKMLRRKHFPDN